MYSKTDTDTKLADKANVADVYSKTDTDTKLADKANAADVYSKTDTDTKLADKANTADVYSKTDADAKFATNDQLQKDVAATNLELANKADKATTLSGYGITNAYTKDEVDEADTKLQKSIDEEARKRKYSVTNLENADKQLQTNIDNEAAAREAEDTRLNSEIVKTNTSLNEAASNLSKLNDTVAKGFEDLRTEDKTLQTNINNEAAAREAADTALEKKVNKNTSDISGMQSDSKVSEDGSYVKTTNTVGENLTALDTGLQAEVTVREDADNKLQSAIDEEARKRKYSVTNLEKADKQLQTNIDNEAAARKAADTKLVEAVNSGLSLSNDNVLQKNTTSVGEDGTVTTSKEAATTLVMNKGGDNQIALSDKGIKVGLNSGVMDKDGFYAGGDTADAAKAALKADGSIKGADGKFAVDADGKVTAASGKIGNVEISSTGAVSGVTDMTASGTITGNKLTDGVASLQNGNLTTTGNINAHAIVATGDISGKAITGTSLNTQGGDINGGAITGTTITGTTGTFGSLTTTGNASVGGTLSANGLINTGNATTDTLTVNHNATVGGNLAVTGDITGKSLNVGTGAISGGQITGTGLDVGAGTIKTTGAVATGTLETTGNATIGGDLTVDKNLTVNGTFDAKTLSSTVDANNYTTINGGRTQSVNLKVDAVGTETQASASTFDENGSNAWAKDDDSIGKSSMTADKISQSLSDKGKNPPNAASRVLSQNTNNKYEITDSVVEGNQSNVENRTADTTDSQISFKDDSGKVLNKSYITQNLKKVLMGVEEGDNKTTIEQDANNIINTAKNGTIKNDAKDLVNTATGNMTNTVGGELLNDVTGDMENKVGGNLTTTVGGTSTETVTGKKTETYNGGLETTVTGEEKHSVNGSQTNSITGDQVNTIGGKQTTTVTGDVTEDYKANLSTTVGGSQTTTVTGDSSLNAENINNTATNKITNKALDVETEAKSSIMNKVSNDYGSNTSTQLSYETKEEMSANGKTASYLRGAAEEKSQLIDGSKKTTIDTVAGQTNTNITEGTNVSNSLQKADQIASSVTDGTNTTVVNQDAKSLASSITDGAKANNTSSTVDASVQRIQTDDTHYSVSSKSASKMEDALFNSSTVIDSLKDAEKGLVSTAVTDGATITGISQNAKDINLSAAGGTIASGAKNISNTAAEKLSNSAADIENKASKSILNQVGENTSWKMTDGTVVESAKDASGKTNQTTTTAADTYQFVKDGDNTLAKRTSSTNDNLNITDGTNTYTKITTATSNKQTVTGGTETASTNLTKEASNTLIKNGTQSVLNHIAADTSYTVMNENGNGSRRQQTASEILDRVTDGTDTSEVKQTASEVAASAKNISNTATDKITSQIGDGSKVKSEMTADGITNITGDNTVTSDTNGTTFENTNKKDTVTFMDEEKSVDTKKTTISGNTITTGEAVMDYADVMKDLGVRGNATIKGDTTMESNASVGKNLTVKGTTTTDKLVVNNGATVTGGTTTDTLHVTSTSTFDGMAAFKDAVSISKDLSVGGNATVAGDVTAKSFKVGDKTYIDGNGINANDQVIRNVGKGDISEGSTDAVSGGQLYETNTRVSGLETRMGTVETRVDKLDNKIDKVGANAAAMANLHPLEFDEDSKWNVAAAVGSSGSETASAVGVFYRPNENVMVNASAAMGTGENMFGGGVSLRLGHGGNKAKEAQMKAAAAENKELRAKVDDLTARMDALLSVLNPNMSKDFPDVPENHWAYEAVSRLAGNGIVEGYEDGKYHGERQMTRYEMAEIIYNALSKGAKAEKKLVEEFRPELQAMAAQKKA